MTGAVHDGERFARITGENGSELLLDVSQTAGYIPLELEKWGVAMAVFAGHKYLLGPQGTGGIYVRKDICLSPHMVGGTGVFSDL
ncbi:aminotransferase class V-fold PLP-dependent enzyme, partial [Acinetobacter sp. 163]|nr:aminotransferase class V-fold PLP-dependent enzyme [Acinetobacter sp. 163]